MESNRSQLDLRSRRRSAVFRAWVGFFGQVVAICMLGIGARLSATDLGPVVREGAQVRLGWTNAPGPLQLQESDSPVGPWTNLGDPASTNSVLINPVASQRFFRTFANGGVTNADEAAMRATLKAVGDFVNAVPRDNPSLWRSQVLTFLQARPDIDSAGEALAAPAAAETHLDAGVAALAADLVEGLSLRLFLLWHRPRRRLLWPTTIREYSVTWRPTRSLFLWPSRWLGRPPLFC